MIKRNKKGPIETKQSHKSNVQEKENEKFRVLWFINGKRANKNKSNPTLQQEKQKEQKHLAR